MFIEIEELKTAVYNYTLGQITTDDVVIRSAILMAIQEATSYLNGRYDTAVIFNAEGDGRNALVLEHCKSMAYGTSSACQMPTFYLTRLRFTMTMPSNGSNWLPVSGNPAKASRPTCLPNGKRTAKS